MPLHLRSCVMGWSEYQKESEEYAWNAPAEEPEELRCSRSRKATPRARHASGRTAKKIDPCPNVQTSLLVRNSRRLARHRLRTADNSGKRNSTTLHGSHCPERCLLRLVLVSDSFTTTFVNSFTIDFRPALPGFLHIAAIGASPDSSRPRQRSLL